MQEIQYIGEHLLPGQLGHFFILLAFVASFLASIAYFFATERRDKPEFRGWRKIGRISFSIHSFSVLAIIGTLFYIMIQQYFEYHYAWSHVSEDLPFKYIFSAFWEGQEGSFLLWMFWHVVLGIILMFTAKRWESPVLSVLSVIQLVINSMILGLYFGQGADPVKIGSNPFLLVRDVVEAPIFNSPDYLSMIEGSGLNPLLQNYWMTIHPPTLFLGFAATAVPFCFAIAGLWTREYKAWLKPVLPWALFTGSILGIGILMGGAWAYEALSFGGYWAWDPVENMSLVPWLILIAGIHSNLIARNTLHSLKSTFVFYLLTFILIVYSTFLTRSGILGDTSVHAFTEMGLEWQLILFILAFTGLSLVLFFKHYKTIPTPAKEEKTPSREFWMFIGSLILLFSALLISFTTSIPVYNKLFDAFGWLTDQDMSEWHRTSPLDPEAHYNKYQLWIAVFIGLVTGIAQLLRYRATNWSKRQRTYFIQLGGSAIAAAGLTALSLTWIEANAWQYKLLLFSAYFAVAANAYHLIRYVKLNLKAAGSHFSHIGFGLMIVGILASGLNKQVISTNTFAQRGLVNTLGEEDLRRNIVLLKGEPMFMSGYEVTYVKDTLINMERRFEVNFKRKDTTGTVFEDFYLYPNILYNKSFTDVAASNPATKRYLDKDIFTHIAQLPRSEIDPEFAREMEDSLKYTLYTMNIGDTVQVSEYQVILEDVYREINNPDYENDPADLTAEAKLRIIGPDTSLVAKPSIILRGQYVYHLPDKVSPFKLKCKLTDVILERLYAPDKDINYQTFALKEGESVTLNNYQVTLTGFNRNPEHRDYEPQETDIAVGAMLDVVSPTGKKFTAEPIYFIRNNRPFNLRDEVLEEGMFFRFTGINPETETMEIDIGRNAFIDVNQGLEILIAENVKRTDYIVMEAILFPGINFFWIGCTLMMLGLGFSAWNRWSGQLKP